jgi:RNA 2',3'-cyclic 3'-phosphodiesterase
MRYRTFIAVEVSPFARDRLRGLQEQLAPHAEGVKWVETNNLHLTLVFLGEVNDREVVRVCRATEGACADAAPFSFTLAGLGAFPTPRRPRTLIAKVREGADAIIALHAALEPALTELGCYRREERAFTPHVTVGRVSSEATGDLPAAILKFAAWQGGETNVREVRVMASELGPNGPEYTILGRAKLRGG